MALELNQGVDAMIAECVNSSSLALNVQHHCGV